LERAPEVQGRVDRLHVLEAKQQMVERDLNILLDPQTLLLVTGLAAKKQPNPGNPRRASPRCTE